MMRLLILLTTLFFTGTALAETVLINATQDNTLYEDEGGSLSNGAGNYMFVGANGEGSKRRALIAFRDLSALPNGAVISSVKLHLYITQEGSFNAETISLARVTKDWGEGASRGLNGEEEGAPAETGDATWIHSMFPGSMWDSPGGDFAEEASASLVVQPTGRRYIFGSSEGLVNDVQDWLDGSTPNYGWILLASDEGLITSKRFDTRSNGHPIYRPKLEVEFSATGSPFDFSGIWYDPALDGEGYNVFETKYGWLIYFFGYSAERGFLWLTSDLVTLDQLVFGESLELPMFIGVPGSFDSPTPASELVPYGTLQVIFNTCYDGVFTLDGLDGMKVSNVIKLAGVEDTTCVDN